MLVPLELKVIADRYGFLSPDIAVGYRAAAHARDYFGDVEELRSMVFCNDGGCFPVRRLLEGGCATGRVIHQDVGQYRFVFMHKPTLTVLNALAYMQVLNLPPCGRCIEDSVRTGGDDAWGTYAALIEDMVGRIMAAGVDECVRSEHIPLPPGVCGVTRHAPVPQVPTLRKCSASRPALRCRRLRPMPGLRRSRTIVV